MKLVREHLNEKKQESYTMDDLSYEFITDILKLGTMDNLFIKFLEKKKINQNYLTDLMKAVIKRIENKWI
jgi:hypothetical protein